MHNIVKFRFTKITHAYFGNVHYETNGNLSSPVNLMSENTFDNRTTVHEITSNLIFSKKCNGKSETNVNMAITESRQYTASTHHSSDICSGGFGDFSKNKQT